MQGVYSRLHVNMHMCPCISINFISNSKMWVGWCIYYSVGFHSEENRWCEIQVTHLVYYYVLLNLCQ